MRITTQMLNETAKKTGIPINQNSLLSYLNDSGEASGNTLLDALDKNGKVSSAASKSYKKLEAAADKLQDSAEKLTAKGEESLFEKIKNSSEQDLEKNKEELYSSIKTFLDNYNAALTELDKTSSPMNAYYSKELGLAASENSKALESLGVTAGKDGRLTLDSGKLKQASVDDIEKVFGAAGTFAVKSAFIAERVSDNAQANVESISSQYGPMGSLQSQLASKFDFWG